MARVSYFTVYVLFKTPEERARWESHLPKPDLGGETAPETCEILPSAALGDGKGGFYEGEFLKVLGRREELVAALIRLDPARCYEPRKDGFVWAEMAPICTGQPDQFAREHVTRRQSYDGGELGDEDDGEH